MQPAEAASVFAAKPQDNGPKPLPRYEQGAALLGSQMFMLGGHYGDKALPTCCARNGCPRRVRSCTNSLHAPGRGPTPSPSPPSDRAHAAGRYLADLWVYDLTTLQWSQAAPSSSRQQQEQRVQAQEQQQQQERQQRQRAQAGTPLLHSAGPPPCAGHSVTAWGERLLVLGGHSKVWSWRVRPRMGPLAAADGSGAARRQGLIRRLPTRNTQRRIKTPRRPLRCTCWTPSRWSGRAWPQRGPRRARAAAIRCGAASACILPAQLLRRVGALLPLCTTTQAIGSDSATRAQATLIGGRLFVFGGEDSARRPLGDLHVLDLPSMAWAEVAVPGKAQAKPPPRCGHAAVVHGNKLFVFGGVWGCCHV